jgi:hypothetical protein
MSFRFNRCAISSFSERAGNTQRLRANRRSSSITICSAPPASPD